MKRFLLHGIVSSAFLLTLAVAHAQTNLATPAAGTSDGFITFDAPGAVNGTFGQAVNPAGVIAGNYLDASFVVHGFVRAKDGSVTTFDVPGAVNGTYIGSPLPSTSGALNPAGAITGTYFDASNAAHGYVRAPDGTLTTFDVPGAGTGFFEGTFVQAITPGGVITGSSTEAGGLSHGFLRAPDGTLTTFDVDAPGAVVLNTVPYAINPEGAITGIFVYVSGGVITGAAFVRAPDGSFTVFYASEPNAINPKGAITGSNFDASFVTHGFVRAPDGALTTFDAPGAGTGPFQGTSALAINPTGEVTGYYSDAGDVFHGFVRDKHGTITTFDAPDSTGTFCLAINPSGVITGGFYDVNGVPHGFVLK